MRQHITAKELRARLLCLHAASGNSSKLHIWFAGVARVTPWAAKRWLEGKRKFRGPALALLEQLELSNNGKE
jgi:hypothetical protein